MFYVKFRRLELGLTQDQVADSSKIYQGDLSRIESGRLNPTDKELKAIARVLACAPERLMVSVDASPLGDGAVAKELGIDVPEVLR